MFASRSLSLFLLISLTACGDKEETEDSGATDDGGDEADGGDDASGDEGGDDATGDDGSTDSCSPVSDGRWETTGACFGHPMDAQLSFDSSGCSFSFSDWSMDMDLPTGGTVSGETVTLIGDSWTSCSGTLNAEGTSITGICENSGCAFGLAVQ